MVRHHWPLLLLPLAALAATLPLLVHGNSCGHDFDFHIDSWIEVSRQWQQGIGWPRWDASANYGAGEPRFVFYPPLSWMLGAVLGLLFGWNAAPATFVFISLAGAAASMYRLGREYADQRAATIAATLYATNPYTLFVVFERAAYSELLAAAWLPLVILYVLRRRLDIPALALAVALCWLTNGPAGVMATYVVALLLILRLIAEREWKNMLRGAAAFALGIALCAFYLLPVAVERRWVQIENALMDDARPDASFLFGHTGSAAHVVVLHTASWLAVVLFATAAVAYPVARRRGGSTNRLTVPAVLVAALLFLMLPVSAVVWRHAPELPFLQFPWRFLAVIAALAALGVCVSLEGLGRYAWAVLLFGALSIVTTYRRFHQICDAEDVVSAQVTAIKGGMGVAGLDEYGARGADISGLASGMPDAWLAEDADALPPKGKDPSHISVGEWKSVERRLVVRADRGEYLIVRLMSFPAWKLRVNAQETSDDDIKRDDGLMVLPVTGGVTRIDLEYREPVDVLRGRMISLAAFIVMLAISFLRHTRRSAQD